MRPIGVRALVLSLAILAACDGDGAASDPCSESAGVALCDQGAECAFDPATIDCTSACMNAGEACASTCPGIPMCSGFDQANCETGCNFAKNQACSNVTFGCFAAADTCDGITSCMAANR